MSIVVTVLHVVACFFLIVVVLLQTGKGADIGAVFGGSSQTIFGSSGAGNLLTRLTTWTAALFMFTSLFLTWSSTAHLSTSVVDTLPAEPPPIEAPLGDRTAPEPGAGAAGDAGAAADTGAAAGAGAPTDTAAAGDAAAGADAGAATAPADAKPAQAQPATDDAAKGGAAGAAGNPAPAAEPAAPANP